MSESPAKQLILPWAAPALLVITALSQMYLAKSEDFQLNPWKGGGFGMFADHHRTEYRRLEIAVVVERDIPVLSSALQNLAAMVQQHLANPERLSLEAAVESQLPKMMGTELEPVWRDVARRCRVVALSDAFEAQGAAFGAEFVQRVRVGEQTGQLPRALAQLGVEIQLHPTLEPRMPSKTIEVVPAPESYADRIRSLETMPSQARLDAFAQDLRALTWRVVKKDRDWTVFPEAERYRYEESSPVEVSDVGVAVYQYDYVSPDGGADDLGAESEESSSDASRTKRSKLEATCIRVSPGNPNDPLERQLVQRLRGLLQPVSESGGR